MRLKRLRRMSLLRRRGCQHHRCHLPQPLASSLRCQIVRCFAVQISSMALKQRELASPPAVLRPNTVRRRPLRPLSSRRRSILDTAHYTYQLLVRSLSFPTQASFHGPSELMTTTKQRHQRWSPRFFQAPVGLSFQVSVQLPSRASVQLQRRVPVQLQFLAPSQHSAS